MTDSIYWIWMQLMFGVGTPRAAMMDEYFSHPRELYDGIRVGTQVIGMLECKEIGASEKAMRRAQEIETSMIRKGCAVLTPDHADYPPLLRNIAMRPAVLYCKGDLACLHTPAVAIIGSREPTEYGKRAAHALADDLASAGIVVVSGLATGIDAESHQAALEAGGKTIGILGCGIDVDYPHQNRALKTAVRQNGVVITEFLPGTQPYKGNFPLRNRLISGMSCATVVVQAGGQSGSMITARLAAEQGRKVFAVPGSIFQPAFDGNHRLLREGAYLAAAAEDIVQACPELQPYCLGLRRGAMTAPADWTADFGIDPAKDHTQTGTVKRSRRKTSTADALHSMSQKEAMPTKHPSAPVLPEGMSDVARAVYAAFDKQEMTMDEIAEKTGAEIGKILAALTELELYALIQRYPGRKFGRNT